MEIVRLLWKVTENGPKISPLETIGGEDSEFDVKIRLMKIVRIFQKVTEIGPTILQIETIKDISSFLELI